MSATLVVAAHGTRSAAGLGTTRSLVSAIAAARPSVPVQLCFLDVAAPSLRTTLDRLAGTSVVVVPLLLSSGFHVQSDIPAIVSGRPSVRVARHLGPDPLVVEAVADRLAAASRGPATTTVLAAVPSSREDARAEVRSAAGLLAGRLGRAVTVLALSGAADTAVDRLPSPIEVAVYLLAEGGFLSSVRSAVAGRGVVAEPIGVHPSLVTLVWRRYDETPDGGG